MEQNFLYLFEFLVDDILVTKPNRCAPDEYPSCCEVSFRNSVFVSICDHEFGQCVEPCKPKCGKSCLFSLESPITDADKLHIHIYKKKTNQCKFLIGCTDLPIKNLFDKVIESFDIANPDWRNLINRHVKALRGPKEEKQDPVIIDNDCYSSEEERHEEYCPALETTKQVLPIFNFKGHQTGNLVLLIRLAAIGPNIVSTFPHSSIYNDGRDNCEQIKSNDGCIPLKDPCHREVKHMPMQRYFACNSEKGSPFDGIEDECARASKCKGTKSKITCPSSEPSNSYSCEECIDECEAVQYPNEAFQAACDTSKCEQNSSFNACNNCVRNPSSVCDQLVQPCPPEPGPEAYDEFEACLNGSGLVIRVLKDTHQVENIRDGTEPFYNDNVSECSKYTGKENKNKSDGSLSRFLQRSQFARNHIKRRTGGRIVNHPNLPKIRSNIKYSSNDICYTEKYNVPSSSKIKSNCDQMKKIDSYRTHRSRRFNLNESDSICQPRHRKDEKSCCIQVDHQDIQNAMEGLVLDTRKKGIEVCYRTCDKTDSDVFLVKLGSKKRSEFKKNNIEIELVTPKMPVTLVKQHVTTETQINEKDLDAALAKNCKGKRGKKRKRKNITGKT